MVDSLKQKKTFGAIMVFIVTTWSLWAEGTVSLPMAVMSSLVALIVAFLKDGWNRSEEILEKITDELKDLKKFGLILAVLCLPVLLSACPSREIHQEVVALKQTHEVYRKHVVPNPDLAEADQRKVKQLEGEITESFEVLEKLTR